LDCTGVLELDDQKATQQALSQNHYYTVGSQYSEEKQLFNFKWSIVSFVISGSAFLACKFLWKMLESNHLTHISSQCRETKSDPEKRNQIASNIVVYIYNCERGQYLMAKYVLANLITLGTMVGLFLWYLNSVDYFNNPFSISEFHKWTNTKIEDRTDVMIKLFPRKLVFRYRSTGPSGTLQDSGILCTAVINYAMENLYASALIFLPILILLQIFSMVFSLLSIILFHVVTRKNQKQIKKLKKLTYGQRLILSLLSKNTDHQLWCAVLDEIENSILI
jgi:hypothetical protein